MYAGEKYISLDVIYDTISQYSAITLKGTESSGVNLYDTDESESAEWLETPDG